MIISEHQIQFLMTVVHGVMHCEHFPMRYREGIAKVIDEINNQQSSELKEIKAATE